MAQPSQADILAALQAQGPSSSRPKPTSKAYAEVQDPYTELTDDGISASRMYCPREGCGCLILLEGTADWVLAEANLIPTESGSPFTPTPSLPSTTPNLSSTDHAGYWHVKGGPMAYENIGYSRPSDKSLPSHAPGMQSGKRVKWLICAECDLGPVGWSFDGGDESWLAADRVRYGPRK